MSVAVMEIPEMTAPGSSIDPNMAALTQIPAKRKRGRPRKDDLTHRRASIQKWQPKRWKPIHEEIVALDCAGAPHAMIASKVGKSVQYVSKICNTPQAMIIKRHALKEMIRKNKEIQEERIEQMQAKAMERISDVLEDDQLARDEPFAVVDKAFKLLASTGVMGGKKENGATHIHAETVNVNNLKNSALVEIKDGLAKSREVREKYQEMEAIDVTSPKVADGRME
jgi:hypothetical protein